ncbi:MAG TPA: hypothetical protein ENJ18_13395 [Nannocystis exedens]|nr:hypothetical protein [Nannocystis exedens]
MHLTGAPPQTTNALSRGVNPTRPVVLRPARGLAATLLCRISSLLLVTAVAFASLCATPSWAAAPSEEAARLYEEGREALDLGDYASAADSFQAAYEAIPREELDRRAALLFELVEARVAAFTEDGRPTHLCKATETLGGFLDDNTELRGSRRSRDARKAADLHETYVDELDLLRSDNPDFQCENAEPPPPAAEDVSADPEPKPPAKPHEPRQRVRLRDPLVGSGVALIGTGTLLLGAAAAGLALGAETELEGKWLLMSRPDLPSNAPEIKKLNAIGKQANLLAIVGGVTGSVALGTGIALYLLGKRRQARSTPKLSLTPSIAPHRLGADIHIRF